MYKHILLPTDGSKLSLAAVKKGIALAGSIGAKVTAVYATPGIGMAFFQADAPLPDGMLAAETARLKQLGQKYLAAVQRLADQARVACTGMAVENPSAYEAIIATAKKRRCDLIVMGSHGRSGVRAFLLGSVTTQVLTHSKVPVLVYRV
jgi:nucleotide-binding universal stress UspA family protein